MFPMHICWADS